MKIVLAYITTKDKAEAKKIGKALVQKKLVGCVNILPIMESIYVWQGKLEESKEAVLLAKTSFAKRKAVEREVKKIHSYSCPCVLFLEVKGGNPNYLKWLADSIR